ncbi:hypothetical protein HON36_04685 [Candidatus Parcubacteria bacterium]|jgi:hypothetical protein|nr:hypothetical protein [Candidatus Parcubacteria bacterium]MBT7228098.1 hypothetical protein [Candidatus Parcubacteria bacterium]
MDNFKVDIARESDDLGIRTLLDNNPVPGKISLLYQKNPSYFQASDVASKYSNTIVIKNNQKDVVAVQTTAIRDLYLDRQKRQIAYLSNLRVDKKYQGQRILKEGFELLKKIYPKFETPFLFSTIIAGNSKLTKKRKDGLQFECYGNYHTKLVILHKKKKNIDERYKIIRGSRELLEDIVVFLQKEGSKKNLYPVFDYNDFIRGDLFKDFDIKDFYVAMDNDEIVGVVGKWDQNKFKQNTVVEYNGIYKYRKIYNSLSKFYKMPQLPKIDETINFAYISFIATKDNDPNIFSNLLKAVYNDNIDSKYLYLALGLHENDPLLGVGKDFRCINYTSKLYFNYWQKPEMLYNFDIGIPYIELATL